MENEKQYCSVCEYELCPCCGECQNPWCEKCNCATVEKEDPAIDYHKDYLEKEKETG
jgi:hypothetical protein